VRGLVALAALLVGCGFATRSDQFECDGSGGCPDGKSCVSGWCVTAAAVPDASVEPPIVCDEGEPCVVDCSEPGSCAAGIDCTGASSCDITCSGDGSCAGHLECEDGPCTVECSGAGSCGGSIDCDDACSCEVSCSGPDSCQSDVDCPFTGQCRNGKECDPYGGAACDQC